MIQDPYMAAKNRLPKPEAAVSPCGGAPTGNAVTPGPIRLQSNFQTIAICQSFSGDLNSNATVKYEYRPAGSTAWLPLWQEFVNGVQVHPMIDRRASMSGVLNPGANEARMKIVGLNPDTSYEIRGTWSDPDGVVGANPQIASIRTKTYTPQIGTGAAVTVGPGQTYTSIQAAIDAGADDITVCGSAAPLQSVNITTSGKPSAYRRLRVNPGDTVTLSSFSMDGATFWDVQGFTLPPKIAATTSTVRNVADVYLRDFKGPDVATGLTAPNAASFFGLAGKNQRLYLLGIKASTTVLSHNPGPYIDGAMSDLLFDCAFEQCEFKGFWEAFGNGANQAPAWAGINNLDNVDFIGIVSADYSDDGSELEGSVKNCLAVGCRLSTSPTQGDNGTAFGLATAWMGPVYIGRSVFDLQNPNSYGFKFQSNPGMFTAFILHVTLDTSKAAGGGHNFCGSGGAGVLFRNCIAKTNGNMYESVVAVNGDYDCTFRPNGADMAFKWQGGASYANLAAFQAGTGQEKHGIEGDPQFNPDYTLKATSPCLNKGVVIPNWNDANSDWPFTGTAPDMGAYES